MVRVRRGFWSRPKGALLRKTTIGIRVLTDVPSFGHKCSAEPDTHGDEDHTEWQPRVDRGGLER